MYYTIRHKTRFRYSNPISQSVMEVRMQPRSEGAQRCLRFQLTTTPRSQVTAHRDGQGNTVHSFDVPGSHAQLTINAEAFVRTLSPPELPETLTPDDWTALDALTATDEHWDYLMPSRFTQPSALLHALAGELQVVRRDDPLRFLRELNTAIYHHFEYAPDSTRVDSPIDDALQERRGVCQDFAHVMIALVREIGIPCRYVSGYLFHRGGANDRSADSATHAWIEALLPGLGWVGFDPTNNLIAGERHIRVAIGRDYADVPPTRGVFKGKAESELTVSVQVAPEEEPPEDDPSIPVPAWAAAEPDLDERDQQQQQQ
jgi:transglutaminase-like putative cysteine protease